jgi:hypothetical protein
MGDQLEDDFDEDHGINNYATYDDDENDDHSLASEEDDGESDGDEGTGGEAQLKLRKKMKRKQKFDEMKLKKKQRLEEENNSTLPASPSPGSSAPVGALTSEDQYRLCSTNCPPSPSFDFHLTPQNFLDLSSITTPQSKSTKKNSFVTAMELGIPSFRQLVKGSPTAGASGVGAPTVVVICAAAKRAADVINLISKDIKCKIGKLFAKHFKVQDQVTALQQGHFPIVVGTPNRLSKLMELGALTLSETRLILVDLEMDAKAFSVLTLPEVCEDFYQLLCAPAVVQELCHLQFSLIRQSPEELEAMAAAEKKNKGPMATNKNKKKHQPPKRVGFNKRKTSNAS